MASLPVRPPRSTPPASPREDEVRRTEPEVRRASHRERVRASLAWAIDEYATTLAKLAR